MNKIAQGHTCRGRGFLPPLFIGLAFLIGISSSLQAEKTSLLLEKTQEFFVRGFSYQPRPFFPLDNGTTNTWMSVKSGYTFLTPGSYVNLYSPTLECIHSFKLPDNWANFASVANDTILYLLRFNSIDMYNLQGKLLRRRLFPSYHFRPCSFSIAEDKIVIVGKTWEKWRERQDVSPVIMIYDTQQNTPPVIIRDFLPQKQLNLINNVTDADYYLHIDITSFDDGFIAVSGMGHEVFYFSSSGKLEWVINKTPDDYKGLSEAVAFPWREYYSNQSHWLDYWKEWCSTWDCGFRGIAILQDTLLVVPRHTEVLPVKIDIYNLTNRTFLARLEVNSYIAGVSSEQLFFFDSTATNIANISAYRLALQVDTLVISDTATLAKMLQLKTESKESVVCSGEGGCCSYSNPFVHVQCAPEKLNVVDTIHAGPNRIARVVCNYALAPDSLFQFCDPVKKNMFVFISPVDVLTVGDELLREIATALRNKNDWLLTCVVCYPVPADLDFYLRDIPGEQILVNRCVSIPDSTLALSDIGQPPMALALSEGGKQVLAGYSLSPYYDTKKKELNIGIAFDEFLEKCGIKRK